MEFHVTVFGVIYIYLVAATDGWMASYCRHIPYTADTHEDLCAQTEYCFQQGLVNDFINGIYFKRGTGSALALDMFCMSMDGFYEDLDVRDNHLNEIGCTKESNIMEEVVPREHLNIATNEFWNASKNFLRAINDVICASTQDELCPTSDKSFFGRYISCFHKHRGLERILFDGPGKMFDKNSFCSSISGIKQCFELFVGKEACSGYDTVSISDDINHQASELGEMAKCDITELWLKPL